MSDTHFTVRATKPDDYRAVHRILTYPRAVRSTLQLPLTSVESWRKRLADPPAGSYSLVACTGGEVIGHLGLHTATAPR